MAVIDTWGGSAGGGSTSISVDLSTATSGNVLVVAINAGSTSDTYSAPGWTVLEQDSTSTVAFYSGALFYKIADGSEGTETFSWQTGSRAALVAAEYSGLEAFDVSSKEVGNLNGPTETFPVTGGAITPSDQPGRVVAFYISRELLGGVGEVSLSDSFSIDSDASGGTGTRPYVALASRTFAATSEISPDWSSTADTDANYFAGLATFLETSGGGGATITVDTATPEGNAALVSSSMERTVKADAPTVSQQSPALSSTFSINGASGGAIRKAGLTFALALTVSGARGAATDGSAGNTGSQSFSGAVQAQSQVVTELFINSATQWDFSAGVSAQPSNIAGSFSVNSAQSVTAQAELTLAPPGIAATVTRTSAGAIAATGSLAAGPARTTNNWAPISIHLVGGWKIPNSPAGVTPTMKFAAGNLDKLPGQDRFAFAHGGKFLEFTPPGPLSTGNPSTWSTMVLADSLDVMVANTEYTASAAFYLDQDTVIVSARKSYRSGFDPDWISVVDLTDGSETYYNITSPDDTGNDQENFKVVQGLGAGFCRLTSDSFTSAEFSGKEFLLGRGGYDVLGSPLGPALATWTIGDLYADYVLNYPDSTPCRRDISYGYPTLDPETYSKAQLPVWKLPDAGGGYWQAGSVGGSAYISLPVGSWFISTGNQSRGLCDYRAQGDSGTGVGAFSVGSPEIFYNPETGGGNRGDHQAETLNQGYPDGDHGGVVLVFEPAEIAEVQSGSRDAWDIKPKWFEFPRAGLEDFWQTTGDDSLNKGTELGGMVWDSDNSYLWVFMGQPFPILCAYEVRTGMDVSHEPPYLPPGWELGDTYEL